MLVRQTNEHPPPVLDPVASAALAKEQWGYYEAGLKREEQKAKAQKDKTCWLRSAVAELDASSVATLRKSYADMFECKEPQWKINMQKHIDKARELESGKDKGDA
jgi:hypothetical protein